MSVTNLMHLLLQHLLAEHPMSTDLCKHSVVCHMGNISFLSAMEWIKGTYITCCVESHPDRLQAKYKSQ